MVSLTLDQPGQPPLTGSGAEMAVAMAERACQLTGYRRSGDVLLLAKAFRAAGRQREATVAVAQAHKAAEAEGDDDAIAAVERVQQSPQP